jgi:uncharacterized protein (TIGR03435 family)
MKESLEDRGVGTGLGIFTGTGCSMEVLAVVLARNLRRPVMDKTGLTGRYDFEMKWTPDSIEGQGQGLPVVPGEKPEGSAASDPGTSMLAALQQQLGLKLESQKAPVEHLTIERAEKPSAN